MKRVNFVREYEAQRHANAGVCRWVLPWPDPSYRGLYNEVRLGLVVELQRIARIPARYRREADREMLGLVLRLLYGPPEPNNLDGAPPNGERRRDPAKLVLISSRDRSVQGRVAPHVRRLPPAFGDASRLPAESKGAATMRRAANGPALAATPALARKASTRARKKRDANG
jgi:hypothetical protein